MALRYAGIASGPQLTALSTAIGATGQLRIYSQTSPAHPESTEQGTPLCTISLPNPPFTVSTGTVSAASYTIISASPWTNTASGGGAGTLSQSWRIYNGATCVMQGDIPGELSLNNATIATGQTVTITQFQITAGNF